MSTNLPKISARFETTLAASMAAGATSFTLSSATDKAGNALSGIYGFVIDNGSSSEEFVIGTVSGNSVTSVVSGLDPANPQTTVPALQLAHNKGASVKITDYPILAYLREMLNGNTAFTLDNPLKYTAEPSFSDRKQLVDKGYADDIISGSVGTASPSTFGTVKTTTSNTTVVSTDDSRVPTANQTAGLASTTSLSASNKAISQSDLQKNAENFVVATGSANAFAATYSPAIAALTTGMRLSFKANFSITGATTLAANGLAAKTIKKLDGATDLVSGDIVSGEIVEVEYDGTNFQLLTPVANAPIAAPIFKSGTTTKDASSGTTTTIAHGLGKTPRYVRIKAILVANPAQAWFAETVYNGTTQSSISISANGGAGFQSQTSFVLNNSTSGTPTNTGTVTFDGTNITITWAISGSPTGVYTLLWEAFG